MPTAFPRSGILAALAIPTDARGRVLRRALGTHLAWLRRQGIDGVLALGSTGEFVRFTLDERKAILEAVAELAAPLPVIANISDIRLDVTAELGRFARRLKLPGVAIMPPSFFPLSAADQLEFFERAAAATQLPVLLYNFPELTGNRIAVETISAFAARADMAGIKQSGREFLYHETLVRLGREKNFSVFSGADTRLPEVFRLGAAGCIGGLVNIVPELMVEQFRVHHAGEPGPLEPTASRMREVGKVIDQLTFPLNVSAGLEARGFEPGAPKTIVSAESARLYKKVVRELRACFKRWGLKAPAPPQVPPRCLTMRHSLSLPDLLVLLAYLVGVTGFGCWFYRRNRESERFMSAGRSLPGWAVGLSIFGSYVSSISFLANPGKSFAGDWNAFVFALTLPLAAWIAVRWFVPFYRSTGEISAYQHLEGRFGPWARTYAVACYLLTQVARLGTILYLLALALVPLTGWDIRWIIVVAGAAVIVYPMLGGTEAVVWTGVVQAVVLVGGALACVAVLLWGMPGGPAQVFEIAAAKDKFSLGSFGASVTQSTFWVVLIYGVAINLQNFGIDQSYVQRYITARSDSAARGSVWLGALLYLPIGAAFFFIGTALFAFYQVQPELLPAAVAARPDAVFPHYISTQLPPGVAGLVIAALCAAAMDSNLNCMSTLFLRDIYQRYYRPGTSEREAMRVLHWSTLGFGAICVGAALAMIHIKSALDVWWELAGIFGGGMLGLFLLGRLSRRADSRAGLAGVALGVVVILWMTLSPKTPWWPEAWRSPFHGLLTIVFGTASILIGGLIAARFFPPRRASIPTARPAGTPSMKTQLIPVGFQTWSRALVAVAAGLFALVTRAASGPTGPAVISAQLVNEGAPYNECHASTIVETAPGKFVAAWFGGSKERNPDVEIWVAHLENGKWLPAVNVANGVQATGPRVATWNPVLFQAPKGPLFLFYKVGPSPSAWWGMVKTSTDGGKTWGEARRLPDGILGPVKNKPVVLADGAWLSGSSTEGNPDGWRVHFEISRDAGATWTKIGPVAKGPALEGIQPSILVHKDGALQAIGRSKQGVVFQTWSKDSGKTWSALTATDLPNPNSGTDAVTLADGRQLIVYNHTGHRSNEAKGDRFPLNVALSNDGLAWKQVLTLDAEPVVSGYAYPAVIQGSDGRIHITYTFARKHIKYVVLDPKKL